MATGESHYGKGDPLVFAAHDETHNDAVVLREILLGRSIPKVFPLRSSSL
jgi:hypothetical protein